jgi:hypothetical protein
MKKTIAFLCAAVVGVVASTAIAKTDKKKEAAVRWAKTYAGALAEMKERGCVLVATFHAEH